MNSKFTIYIAIVIIFLTDFTVSAATLDRYLMSKSDLNNVHIGKNTKYDSLFIERIRQNEQSKPVYNPNANNIQKILYLKAEKTMAIESLSIEKFLKSYHNPSMHPGMAISGFIIPLTGEITSYFGNRIHPIYNVQLFHSGIDICAAANSPIKAANSGRVIFTGNRNGYGNTVIINHGLLTGSDITSVYGHLAKILTYDNEYVQRGQIIGYEGSTGISTGTHLHFEIRKNGIPVNPLFFVNK